MEPDPQFVAVVGAVVAAIVEAAKAAGLPKRWAPAAVLAVGIPLGAVLAEGAWRPRAFAGFAVAMAAAGGYSLLRAGSRAGSPRRFPIRPRRPPDGLP